jgi:hypothetical protein
VAYGVDDQLADDQLRVIGQLTKAPAGEQVPGELAGGPGCLWLGA